MAQELLRGRERRYFGYMGDCQNMVDTPESAKSYRSVLSLVNRKVDRQYERVKSFKPDPPGKSRFADKIIHHAVQSQIPGLLPALKNSPQFEEFQENPIFLRSPDFEQHKERSLHYFWLPRHERTELCGIFHSHLKNAEKWKGGKRFIPGGKRTQLIGLAAETAILDQQEYLDSIANDPKIFNNKAIKKQQKRRLSEVPSRMLRMNRKFQSSYWDPTLNKHITDPFRRIRGKLPACDAVCHEHFQTGTPELSDLLACLDEYQRRYEETQDFSGEVIELEARREHLRRLSLFGTLEDEERRRGMKHIKELKEYDRESEVLWTKQAKLMIAAAEYLNKIKNGRRFPTPPREIRARSPRRDDFSDGASARSEANSINVEEYLQQHREGKGGHQNPHSQKWRKRRHFHHNYNTEEFYMEMYLHFLNPDEDVSLKAPPKQLTDVKELRKRMNLDEDHEKEKKLLDLMNESSVEALNTHGGLRKSQLPRQTIVQLDIEQEKEMIEQHLKRLKNPRLRHVLTRMMSQISLTSSSLGMTSSSGSKKTPAENEAADAGEHSPQAPTVIDGVSLPPGSSLALSADLKKVSPPEQKVVDLDDDDLDEMGDIPEHELRLILSEIASSRGSASTDNLSSGSSGGEEEEMEGEDGDDDALKLFKTARKKKDSLAEFMDLTTEFRARICQGEEGNKPSGMMNPFAEAVCVLYPDGTEKNKMKVKSKSKTNTKALNSLASLGKSKSEKVRASRSNATLTSVGGKGK